MAISKHTIKKNGYRLKGSLKKSGLDCWRYFFSAINTTTSKENSFFIELFIENPANSPNEFVLSHKSRPKIKESDFNAALLGHLENNDSSNEQNIIPSFVAVRAGVYGDGRKQINRFYSFNELKIDKKRFCFEIGDNLFSDDTLCGSLFVSEKDSENFPEYMSQSGSIQWNLHYERFFDFPEIQDTEERYWLPSGVRTNFSGRIIIDNQEYVVSPQHSFGYCDKVFGKDLPQSFFHLSSCKLTSIFSGRILDDSAFSLQGVYNEKLSLLCKIQNEVFNFSPSGNYKKYSIIYNCAPVPGEETDEQLHWSISLNHNIYVCDIDVFCSAKMMLVRDYELPEGNCKIQKILSGSHGSGEIRIYKKNKKTIELIHHAKIENCVCEYGTVDDGKN